MSVHYQPVKCKSFLHHFNKKFLPFNWGANPYRGCEHSCPYCFARYTHEYLGYNSDTEFDNKIEPRAATIDERLDAVKQLSDAGVTVGILFMPIFPYLTDDRDSINGVVKAVRDAGAKDMDPGVLDLRASCRNRVLSLIKEEFPDLLPKYLALYKTAYAPKDYTGKIHRTVEIARRSCGFKKFEMPVLTEKQTRLEV